MKPTLADYYKDILLYPQSGSEDDKLFNHELFTDMMIEASCIIDFQKQNFKSVGDHGFFLCGYPLEKAKTMGYLFFNEVIHPDDIFLWADMHNVILKSLHKKEFAADEVHYFSCTFRIQNSLQFSRKSIDYLMAYLKLKPVWINRQLKYGLCLLASSVIKTSGNLRVYYKRKKSFSEYSIKFKKWIHEKREKLSLREKKVLMLEKQGMSREEEADTMCVTVNTMDNIKKKIIEKLGVKNIRQAIIYATNHRLIFDSTPSNHAEQKEKTNKKNVLCPDILKKIQAKLEKKQSVHSIANEMDILESTVRKAIKSGKLIRK